MEVDSSETEVYYLEGNKRETPREVDQKESRPKLEENQMTQPVKEGADERQVQIRIPDTGIIKQETKKQMRQCGQNRLNKDKEKEDKLEVAAKHQKPKDGRRQLQDREEEKISLAWQENLESHQENMKSWVEDVEEWQQTLGAGEDPLRKAVIFAFFVVIIITVMLIALVLYIRDLA